MKRAHGIVVGERANGDQVMAVADNAHPDVVLLDLHMPVVSGAATGMTQSAGASLTEARTAALNLFVIAEMFYLFACRSLTHSAWHIGLFSNKWLIVGVSVQIIGQLAITYLPAMNRLFQTAPIGIEVWLRIVAIAALASLVVAIDKRLRRELM